MKKILILSLIGLVTTFLYPDNINKSIPSNQVTDIEIYNISGSVKVVNDKSDKITLEGYIGKDVEDVIFKKEGNIVIIKIVLPKSGINLFKDFKSIITITLPENINVKVETVSASIDVNLQNEKTTLNATSGYIKGFVVTEELQIAGVCGDIDFNGEADSADVNLISGDIRITGNFPDVSAKTVSGNVFVETKNSINANLSTTSGNISYESSPKESAKIELITTSGSVDVLFHGKTVSNISAQTLSGKIRINGLDDTAGKLSNKDKEFNFSRSKGTGRLKINTFSGNITITLR